jgi:hypothetical protein
MGEAVFGMFQPADGSRGCLIPHFGSPASRSGYCIEVTRGSSCQSPVMKRVWRMPPVREAHLALFGKHHLRAQALDILQRRLNTRKCHKVRTNMREPFRQRFSNL